MASNEVPFDSIKGMTFADIKQIGDGRLMFTTTAGEVFTMLHEQDCCESVVIESIVGDLEDLIGTPILTAEEATSGTAPADATPPEYGYDDSNTWTFYKLATIKGYVDIRWHGSSNGYYSESVSFVRGTEYTYIYN